MSLGEHKAITILHLGMLWIEEHRIEEQSRHDIRCAKTGADVSGLRLVNHVDDIEANILSNIVELAVCSSIIAVVILNLQWDSAARIEVARGVSTERLKAAVSPAPS